MILESYGASVVPLNRLRKARRLLETMRPHVLVTDIAMPDDGFEVGEGQAKGIHVPTIAPTAYQARRKELLAEGFEELLEKHRALQLARRPLRAKRRASRGSDQDRVCAPNSLAAHAEPVDRLHD